MFKQGSGNLVMPVVNNFDTQRPFCQVFLAGAAGIISSGMFYMPVDEFYVGLYSEIKFSCPDFSEGANMYTLNKLTRRDYYQRVSYLS